MRGFDIKNSMKAKILAKLVENTSSTWKFQWCILFFDNLDLTR